ncbi:MAG: FapA family protein [Eubacteriales bacterium]|nr:FapA family protein [Eubacteriales bacterium]
MDIKAYDIRVTKDKMQVVFCLERISDVITTEQILNDLTNMGIRTGINKEIIDTIVESKPLFTEYVIAEGIHPTKPFPGRVDYFFKTGKDIKPSMDKDGNVDFKNLSLISNVKEGELLAKLMPVEPGEPGVNVYGEPIAAMQAKPLFIKGGKNTRFNEEKTELYAVKNGMVTLLDGVIVVNDVYQVPNNVGTSTGNINFEGNVIVTGNILTGFEVVANGDIEVFGAVEGASLKAGGNIILHSGISGMGRGIVEANGNLMTKYIEQSNVRVRGNVHASAILHSDVRCGGSVVVEGKKSLISGGRIISGNYVETVTLGSHMGTLTEIEVGVNPVIAEEYEELKKRIPKVQNEIEQIEKVITLLNKRREIAGKLEEDKQEMYASAVKNKIMLGAHIQKLEKQFKKLEEEMNMSTIAEIRINGVAHSGCRLTINNVNRNISDDVKAVKFIRDGADLRMVSI